MMNPEYLKLALELRHELHRNPSLSNHEEETKQRVYRFLKEHTGLELHDCGLWMYAVYRSGNPAPGIAFRADYDALPIDEASDFCPWASKNPGISHKCGHDGHTAALCALALEIDHSGAPRDVYFLFQHAEETGDGAKICCRMLTENNIGEIYAWHNSPDFPPHTIALRNGVNNCASKGMNIYMQGVPAHASMPEKGRSPAFAIANIVSQIPELIQPSLWSGMVLCTVVQIDVGKKAFGSAAGSGVLRMTLRALYLKELEELQQKLIAAAQCEAEKYGLTVSYTYNDEFPDTVNDDACIDRVRAVANRLGLSIDEMPAARRGSDDFGWFTKVVPGAYFHIGNGGSSLHTQDYEFNDEILETAVSVMLRLSAGDT